jgi:excisionase family DNA binding protein
MNHIDRLLTVAETAAVLNVSVKTVRRRIELGQIAVVRIGRSVRVQLTELRRFQNANLHFGHARPQDAP